MAQAYKNYQKAVSSGNQKKIDAEAGNLTRWANAYRGTQNGRLASTNTALVERFGSAESVKQMLQIVRDVNSGSGKLKGINQDLYGVKAFQDYVKVIVQAQRDFGMNMKYLFGEDFLKTIKLRSGKPTDVQQAEAKKAESLKGHALNINENRRSQSSDKVSMDALQYRVDELEGELDKVLDEYINGKAKSMDEAIDKVFGKGNRSEVLSKFEEYKRITGNKKRYDQEYFKLVTPESGKKDLGQQRRHWQKAAYTDTYAKNINNAYADYLKKQGADKVDLSMAPENFDIPQKLKDVQVAAKQRLKAVQDVLDEIAKKSEEKGSLNDVINELSLDKKQQLKRQYSQFLRLGGNEQRYKTIGGELPFNQLLTASQKSYQKTGRSIGKTYRQQLLDWMDRQATLKRGSLQRQIQRGQHFINPKTSTATTQEQERILAELAQKEIERIAAQYNPQGKNGLEKRKDQLQRKLVTAFNAAKKANEKGHNFSVSGAYGVGNDAQIRSDYYEWLALGGNPDVVSWGEYNPFEGNYWNAMRSERKVRVGDDVHTIRENTEDVKKRWRGIFQDDSPDAVQRKQDLESKYNRMYEQRAAKEQQARQKTAEAIKKQTDAQRENTEEKKKNAQARTQVAAKAKEQSKQSEKVEQKKTEQKKVQEKKPQAPSVSPREKRLQDLYNELMANIDKISPDDKELLAKYNEFKALGGKSTELKNAQGKMPYSTAWSKPQMAASFKEWSTKVKTPEYAKSIGEETQALREENAELEKNNTLKKENISQTQRSSSANQKSSDNAKESAKTVAKLTEADKAAMEKRKQQLLQSLATANSNVDLGIMSQADLKKMLGQYYEFQALGGKLKDITDFTGGNNNFEKVVDSSKRAELSAQWKEKVKSPEYIKGLQQQNAALDKNTEKVRENQQAKQEGRSAQAKSRTSSETERINEDTQAQNKNAQAIKARKRELQQQLKQMVKQSREMARSGGSGYGDFNDHEFDDGYGSAIQGQISQLEHLQDEQDEAIEKWNQFRALGGQAKDILGKDASDVDIQALQNMDRSSMIQGYKEQHGLAQQVIEDKKKQAEAQRELNAQQSKAKPSSQDGTSTAENAQRTAEALSRQAEARKKANDAQAQGAPAQSAAQAQKAAESAERMANAQVQAAQARKKAAEVSGTKQAAADQGRPSSGTSLGVQQQAMSGLAGSVDKVSQAITRKNNRLREEQGVVNDVVETEKTKFSQLATAIQTEVPNAIQAKNNAFTAQQGIVEGVVAAEKGQIDSLAQNIETKIPTAAKEIGRAMTDQESEFSTSTTNIKNIVTQLCDSLRQIADAANQISSANFDNLGKVVGPLKAFRLQDNVSQNLKNFSGEVKNTTGGLSKYSKKAKVDTSAFTTMGDAIQPFKVDEKTVDSLKKFITQIKSVKKALEQLGSMDQASVDGVAKLTDSISNLKVGKATATNLQALIAPLTELADALGKLSNSNVNIDTIQNVFNSISALKPGANVGERITSLSQGLKQLGESLKDFKGIDASTMQNLNTLLSNANGLRDVAAVLKASMKNVKSAKEKVDVASGVKTEQETKTAATTKEKTPITSDTEAILKRGEAVRKYNANIEQRLVLQQKIKSMEQHNMRVPNGMRERSENLRKLIQQTKEYIDIETGEYNQQKATTQARADSEKTTANAVAESTKKAKQSAAQIKKAYDIITQDMLNPDTEIGGAQQRLMGIDSADIEGMGNKIDVLRQKIMQLNEALALKNMSPETYAQNVDKLLKPYEKATAVLTGMSRDQIQNRMRQNLLAAATARGATAQEGDVSFSGAKNMRASLRVTNKKGQTQILTQQFNAESEALGRLESMYTTTKSSADKFFDSLKSHARSLTTYLATFVSFYRVVDVFKRAVGQIKEFDTALTEMRKVSDESIDRLKNFQKESFNMAEQIGTTAQQIQNSTADFLRLGQDFKTAKQSAMNANILFNVSEFQNIDDATTSLIAMTQAFKDVSQTHIIDSLNKVGNDFSISTSGLSQALQRSASALTTSGNSLEESIALNTAANQVVQNPQNVGAAMKIVSLRLAGQKQQIEEIGEDTEGMVTTVSKLRAGIMNATKAATVGMKGIDIEDSNGNLKNTYEILQEIADIWDEIGQQDKLNGTNQQNYLLQTMAGKNRSNVLASLLQSPDVLRNAYEEALDSDGSALIENQKQLESVQGHLNRIKNEASELAYNMLSSNGLKGIIDLGTQLLKLLNSISGAIGTFPTLGLLGTGALSARSITGAFRQARGAAAIAQQVSGIKNMIAGSNDSDAIIKAIKGNVQFGQMSSKDLTNITNTISDASVKATVQQALGIQQIGEAAQAASQPVVGFGSVLRSAFSGANLIPTITTIATLILSVGSAIYNAHQKAKQARLENAAEVAGQFKDTVKDIDSQVEKYSKLSQSLSKNNISEHQSAKIKSELLSIQNQLNETYGKQAEGIDLVNGSLDKQIEKLEQIKVKNAQRLLGEAGAKGQSKGDFADSYNAMTRQYEFIPNLPSYKKGANVSGEFNIGKGSGIQQITQWAKRYADRGLVMDEHGAFNRSLTATGTAKEILSLLQDMGDDLEKIPDYDEIKDSGNYKTLETWINDATKHFSGIIAEHEGNFLEYLNMKLLADQTHGITYQYGGEQYENGNLGSFYYRYQLAADEYNSALKNGDEKAKQQAKAAYEAMQKAWLNRINEMHKAGDHALDDYQILMDGISDSINSQGQRAYLLSQEFTSDAKSRMKNRAARITGAGISKTEFLSAATTEGNQRWEAPVQRALEEALRSGFITDIEDTSQIEWLADQLEKLGVFGENAAKAAKKADGTFASFLETISDSQKKTSFSDLIDDLQSKSSSLENWSEKFAKGEMDSSALTDLFQEFPDLASDAQFLQSVTDNMNADGFVDYSRDIQQALTDLSLKTAISSIQKMNEELSDPDSYDQATRNVIRAQRDILINSLDLSDVSNGEVVKQIWNTDLLQDQAADIRQLLSDEVANGDHGAQVVARLLLDDRSATWTYQQWKKQIQSEQVEVQLKSPIKDFKKSVEATQNMMSKNAKLTSFEQSLESGKATAQDLLGIVDAYPAEFEQVSSVISDVLSDKNMDGTINGAEELSNVFAHIRATNLEDSLANAKTDYEKIIAYSQADLNGISSRDAENLIKTDGRTYDIGGKTRDDLIAFARTGSQAERQAAVIAQGMQISFTDAMDIVEQRAKQVSVSAIKSFESITSAVDSFKEKASAENVASGDVLGLVETFPELLQYTDVLGQAFSDLSLKGALNDASQLEAVLTKIQQERLAEVLKDNNINNQSIVQGMASQIDFSGISKGTARGNKQWLSKRYGVDLSEFDQNTAEGRDIIGRIHFVIENADVTDVQKVIDDAVAEGANNGLKNAMADMKNLDSALSSLNSYSQKAISGQLTASDLNAIQETFSDLITNGDDLNALYGSLNMDGFVADAETANALINSLKIAKVQKFIDDQKDSTALTRQTERAMVNQTRLSGVDKAQAEAARNELLQKAKNNPFIDTKAIEDLMSQGPQGYNMLVRLNMFPDVQNEDEFKQNLEDAASGYVKDVQQDLKVSIDIASNISSSNSGLTDFDEKLKSGQATRDDLLTLLKDVPKLAQVAGEEMTALFDASNADGTLNNIEGISEALADVKVENLKKGLEDIGNMAGLSDVEQQLMRRAAFASSDLSGISIQSASQLVQKYASADEQLKKMAQSENTLEREAAATAAGMGISFSDAYAIIESRAERAKISSLQSIRSIGDQIANFSEKVSSNEVTSDDILGLVESFPQILDYTDVLGDAFSDLSLSGAVNDASQLEALLLRIQQMKLAEYLSNNGIRDQSIVQGMANSLDFSSIAQESARNARNNLESKYGIDLSNIDIGTKEGRDIIGHIKFVADNSDVVNIQSVVENATANGTHKGVKRGIQEVKNLSDFMSTLSNAAQSVMSGEFSIDDVASLEETFSDMQLSGEQLDAIYSSLNMDGFIEDAEAANALINSIKLNKLTKFFSQNESMSSEAQRALLNATRLSGVSRTQGINAYSNLMNNRSDVDKQKIKKLYSAGDWDALVRINLIPEYNGQADFEAAAQEAIDASAKDSKLEFTEQFEVLTNLSTKNTGISDFVDQVAAGEATVDGLFSLIQEVPEIALNSGDALAQMMDSADFDGKITSIEGLQAAAQSFTLKNIADQFKQIENLNVSDNLKSALKGYMLDMADLSGTSFRDLSNATKTLDSKTRKDLLGRVQRGELSAEAVMKVVLRGDVDASDIQAQLQNEQAKIERRQMVASVNARIAFNSDMSSIQDALGTIDTQDMTVDAALSLAQSMPEILDMAQELGYEFTDMNMDGVLDDAQQMKKVLSNVQANKLMKFIQNDKVSRAGKMTAIANTALNNMTLEQAQKILGQNAKLVAEGLENPVSREAAVKAKLSLDAQNVDENAAEYKQLFQNAMDGYTIDISFRMATDLSRATLDQIGSIGEQMNSASAGSSVSVDDWNLSELENYKQALEYTSDSIQYNYQKVRQLNKAKAEQAKKANNATKAQKENAYRENAREITELTKQLAENKFAENENAASVTAHIAELMNDNSTIRDNITQIDLLNAAIDESISKYQAWQNAQSAPESGDMFDDTKTMWQELADAFDPESDTYQKYGTEKFKTAADFLMPDDADTDPAAIKEWQENTLKRYLTFDENGAAKELNLSNFFNDLVDKGYATIEDGQYKMIGEQSMEEIAKGMNVGVGFIQAAFGEANEYIFDEASKYKFGNEQASFSDIMDNAGKAKNALETLDGTKVDIDISGLDDDSATSKLNGVIEQLQGKKLQLNPEVDTTQIQEANQIIAYCVAQMAQLNQPVVMKVDTSQLPETSQQDGTAQAISDAQALYNAQTNKEIAIKTGADTTEAQAEIDALVQKIQGESEAMIKIGIKVDQNSTAKNILDQLGAQDETVYTSIGVKLADGATDELDSLEDFQIGDKKFSVIAQNLSSTLRDTYSLSNVAIEDKKFTIEGTNLSNTLMTVNQIVGALGRIQDKTVTITTKKVTSGGSDVLGTAHVSGTLSNAYARGRNFTVGRNETALVNEVGQQSRVHNGRWELLPGGPHMQKLDKDDII